MQVFGTLSPNPMFFCMPLFQHAEPTPECTPEPKFGWPKWFGLPFQLSGDKCQVRSIDPFRHTATGTYFGRPNPIGLPNQGLEQALLSGSVDRKVSVCRTWVWDFSQACFNGFLIHDYLGLNCALAHDLINIFKVVFWGKIWMFCKWFVKIFPWPKPRSCVG